MARKLRVEFEGAIYHVTIRGVERRAIFRDDADRGRFAEQLSDSVDRFGVRLYLYCLMPNHVHLVVETPKANLSAFMQRFQTAYTVYFNLRHRRAGHLMQGRYGAQLVQGDEYLLKLSRYIHLNPVFVGEVAKQPLKERARRLRAYGWSSYRGYAGLGKASEFVDYAPVLALVGRGSRRKLTTSYRKFVEAGLARTDEEFMEVLKDSAWGIGDAEFREKVQRAHSAALEGSHRREEDVSFRRTGSYREPEPVLNAVGKVFGVKAGSLRVRSYGQPARSVAMMALGKHAGLNQREVAAYLRVGTGSAVCRAVTRLARQRATDRDLDQKCAAVEVLLSE